MATENVRKPKETSEPGSAGTRMTDTVENMWDATFEFQRRWASFWAPPWDDRVSAGPRWRQWQILNNGCLDFAKKTSDLTNGFVTDQVKFGRELSDHSLEMTRNLTRREPEDITPALAREWFDTTRRSAERTFSFGNDSVKAAEELGLQLSETLTPETAGARRG